MNRIIVYDKDTGIIARCVCCPNGMEDVQCHENELYIEGGPVDDSQYKIDLVTLEIISLS